MWNSSAGVCKELKAYLHARYTLNDSSKEKLKLNLFRRFSKNKLISSLKNGAEASCSAGHNGHNQCIMHLIGNKEHG